MIRTRRLANSTSGLKIGIHTDVRLLKISLGVGVPRAKRELMQYLIDGYNLLFRLLHKGQEVRQARESMIVELSQKAALSDLDITLVSTLSIKKELRQSRKEGAIRVVYTNEGETADEWIIRECKKATGNTEDRVVTSDKRLAVHIRVKGIQTVTCEEFIAYLNKRCKAYFLGHKKRAEPTAPLPPPLIKKVAKGTAEYYKGDL